MKRKIVCLSAMVLATSLSFSSAANAQEDSSILNAIKQDTANLLLQANAMFNLVNQLPAFLNSWLWKATGAPEEQFFMQRTIYSTLADTRRIDYGIQAELTKRITQDFMKGPAGIPIDQVIKDPYPASLDVNSLLGQPVIGGRVTPPGSAPGVTIDPAEEFVKYASGIGMGLTQLESDDPKKGRNWTGTIEAQNTYKNYYNTIVAIQSYNADILSRIYAERKASAPYPAGIGPTRPPGSQTSSRDLLSLANNQIGSADWYDRISTQSLGWVLRQLLVYTGQTAITTNQLLETQQQALAAQAMTNVLLITIANQTAGAVLMRNAKEKSGAGRVPSF